MLVVAGRLFSEADMTQILIQAITTIMTRQDRDLKGRKLPKRTVAPVALKDIMARPNHNWSSASFFEERTYDLSGAAF